MRHFDDVFAVFEHTNEYFERQLLDAQMLDALIDSEALPEWVFIERQQQINEHAYFVLLFSQLESEVNRLCGELIRRMKALPDWQDRRAWDILDDREDRLRNTAFMNRVALLTSRGGTVYNRVKDLYDTRNMIAHGGLPPKFLELTRIAKEMQGIASQLQERP